MSGSEPSKPSWDEERWIRFLRDHLPNSAEGVIEGIGDDAAVLDPTNRGALVFCSDQTVEDVHFRRAEGLWWAGRKALARCLSDLAAMAARPWTALLSLAVPPDARDADIEQVLRGVLDTATAEQCALVGGDLCTSTGGFALDVSVVGAMEGRKPWLRSTARVGDELIVTGPLGGSGEGHHLRFVPRWREALALADLDRVRAAIDLSDGLARDLRRLLAASAVGARIERDKVPRRIRAGGAAVAESAAWGDGEDFELLLCAAPGTWEMMGSVPGCAHLRPARIGQVVETGLEAVDADGSVTAVPEGGYGHRLGTRASL